MGSRSAADPCPAISTPVNRLIDRYPQEFESRVRFRRSSPRKVGPSCPLSAPQPSDFRGACLRRALSACLGLYAIFPAWDGDTEDQGAFQAAFGKLVPDLPSPRLPCALNHGLDHDRCSLSCVHLLASTSWPVSAFSVTNTEDRPPFIAAGRHALTCLGGSPIA